MYSFSYTHRGFPRSWGTVYVLWALDEKGLERLEGVGGVAGCVAGV